MTVFRSVIIHRKTGFFLFIFFLFFFLLVRAVDSRDTVDRPPAGDRVDRPMDTHDGRGSAEFRVPDAAAGQHQSDHTHRVFRLRREQPVVTDARDPGR